MILRWFRKNGARIVEAVLRHYRAPEPEALSKSANQDLPEFNLDGLDLSMRDALDDLDGAIKAGVDAGLKDTAAIVGIDLKTPPKQALAYSRARAAELVGMKIGPDGEIYTNPNPRWAITETIREEIKAKVTAAIKRGWSPQDLKASLTDLFDPSRAAMIARTETGFAYNEGAIAIYEDSGQQLLEVLDGDGCLPGGHNDGAEPASGTVGELELENEANGQIWPVQLLRTYRLGHPNCVRAFIPYEAP